MMEMRKRGVGVDKIVYGDRLGIYFLVEAVRGFKVVYDRAFGNCRDRV